ncbi:MAG TPA: DUF2061 domain-containing protein [Chitinophagaceae bacterium]|nr:DUF2061 domain-containing protein [Chitinophagaceae bacterium]
MAKKTPQEKSLRIVVKAASWRIIGTCDTILLSLLFTGQITSALKIGFSEVFTKIGLFYLHERYVWANIKFGRVYAEDGKTVIGDKHYRSIIKGASWRFFGTLDTIMLALLWTGDYKKALAIGSTEVITKISLFWLHERVWFKIKWGQPKKDVEVAKNDDVSVTLINVDEPKEIPVAI